MNNKIMYGLVVVAVLIVGGVVFSLTRNSSNSQQTTTTNILPTEIQSAQTEEAKQDKTQQATGGFSQRFVAYSPENLAKATENDGKAVIFFHASWCPSCKAAEADFSANFDQVPENVTILKTDYDTATDLKKKYNITSQDTFVQVDSSGEEITKWNSGGKGVATLLANAEL